MKKKIQKAISFIACCGVLFCSVISAAAYNDKDLELNALTKSSKIESIYSNNTISNGIISSNSYKFESNNNPISSEVFYADPTSVEYNGRLYVYGTNDHQQYETNGPDKDNSYDHIKSFVIYSTDDMVNWVYHGTINTKKIAPWINVSWAPSVVSRIEEDGLTHFYLYFSNGGSGVGVLEATNPLGPWTDPLGKPLVSSGMKGLENCPYPFDPGVCIDENGQGWLTFGGGIDSYLPSPARIVKLGDDMLSFASDFKEIPAPYFLEASELNYINGTYVYTYNSDWSDHKTPWDYDCAAPSDCSMVYMTSKTPLDPNSWEMKGEYFKNPGLSGFDYSNNHTHFQKFKDNYYILYHTLSLRKSMGIYGGYRSLCVDKLNVDEDAVVIKSTGGTRSGVKAVSSLNPYVTHLGMELSNTADVTFDASNNIEPVVISDAAGAWINVKNVRFSGDDSQSDTQVLKPTILTNINTISYDITVTSADKDTTITMYPSAKGAGDCIGSAKVSGNGRYTITCDLGGASMMQNLGYFRASDDAKVTFILNKITINDEYVMEVDSKLSNTSEWGNGLKNIWNNFSDGDEVYSCDTAVFKYIKSDDAIELFTVDKTLIPAPGDEDIIEDLKFLANVKGSGRIEVRLDKKDGELLTSIDFKNLNSFTSVFTNNVSPVSGKHDLYFVFSNKNIAFKLWQFTDEELIADVTTEPDTPKILMGDINNDGKITTADVGLANAHAKGTKLLNDEQFKRGDVNNDKKVSTADVGLINAYAKGTKKYS